MKTVFRYHLSLFFCLLVLPLSSSADSGSKRVFFVSPADGTEVSSPVRVVMGVQGMEVKPAGEIQPGTGHHHIIIDGKFIALGNPVPADEQHIHFGGGQTETELKLAPGKHTLTLQFADGSHSSYGEKLSSTITVIVR